MHPNSGKRLSISVEGVSYDRFAIKTKVISAEDSIEKIVEVYAAALLHPGDILAVSERVVAITQGRSYKISQIRPSALARFLSRFVSRSPYGIGLAMPETMHLAIQEVGAPRILLAALAAAVTKPLGIKGVFYRIAGRAAASIDGPCSYTLPPYNEYATLGPKNPNTVACRLQERFGREVVIIDANDLGVDILGRSSQKHSKRVLKRVFADNPLGQSDEQTPLCIVRKTKEQI